MKKFYLDSIFLFNTLYEYIYICSIQLQIVLVCICSVLSHMEKEKRHTFYAVFTMEWFIALAALVKLSLGCTKNLISSLVQCGFIPYSSITRTISWLFWTGSGKRVHSSLPWRLAHNELFLKSEELSCCLAWISKSDHVKLSVLNPFGKKKV